MVIYNCLNAQKNTKKKKVSEESKRFDSFFAYVERPILLEKTLTLQAEKLLKRFKET